MPPTPTSRRPRRCRSTTTARYVLSVYRGVLRIRTGRFDEAITDLNAAIKLKPRAYQAFVNLAQAYRLQHQPALALEQFDQRPRARAAAGASLSAAGRLYLDQRARPRLADFEQAISRENPDSSYQVDDHVEQGQLFLSRGDFGRALESFDAALGRGRKTTKPASASRRGALSSGSLRGRGRNIRSLPANGASRSSLSIAAAAWSGRARPVPRCNRRLHQGPRAAPHLGRAGISRLDLSRRQMRPNWPCATSSSRSSSTPKRRRLQRAGIRPSAIGTVRRSGSRCRARRIRRADLSPPSLQRRADLRPVPRPLSPVRAPSSSTRR